MFENLALGFAAFGDQMVWAALVFGAFVGYIIGAFPGLGPSLGVALLIPFCFVGAYASETTMFRAHVMVLGEMMEPNFRRALISAKGDWAIFYTSPLTVLLLSIAVLAFVLPGLSAVIARRRRARAL